MHGVMNPIRQRLMSGAGPRMQIPGSKMPVMYPQTADDMDYPGGGDLGMEMSEPYTMPAPEGMPDMGAQAMPVHSTPEMQAEYKRMGKAVPGPMQNITRSYEQVPMGPLKSRLHAAQHQMMVSDQGAVLQSKRMELAQKKMDLESRLQAALRSGKIAAGSAQQRQIEAMIAGMNEVMGGMPTE